MSELFRSYEDEYFEASNGIKRSLAELKSVSGDAKKRVVRKIEKDLDTANKQIKQMNLEMTSTANPQEKENLKKKLKTYGQDLTNLKKEFEGAKSDNNRNRDALFSGGYDDDLPSASDDYRNRLVQSTQVLERSNETLDRASKILDETEQMGVETAGTLREQGERMKKTRDKLYDVDSQIKQGGRILGRMSRREVLIKVIIIAVILFLLLIIGIILFFIFYGIFKPSK
ncbi:vesicle transport v-snare protein [Naegleria gruberi]|uniref:Vesicle transport v-snare protein n=1 Tax=Naegleria gruberi TaxID=5762 RepID=D2VVL3_NAEGR|nr:vesicle transport v-snare protein [Naegleria gruberi]EFC39057.1 vesicle transport v-snare protein [Naegleria gruberi]|eukprot:XP_002671801.1 vesicle transport v-snare protein [Naegleria gruberi strain NEG-M]